MKRFIALILSLTLVLSMLSSCGSSTDNNASTSAAESSKIVDEAEGVASETEGTEETVSEDSYEGVIVRLGEQPSGGTYFSLADYLGYLDDIRAEGVTFEFDQFQNGPAMNEAFAGGQLDLAIMGTFPVISGIASGYEYKVVSKINGGEQTSPLIAGVDSGISSVEDLKGKNVGTYIGGSWQYILLKYLEGVGLTEDDIGLFNTAADTATSLRSGDIDAAVLGIDTAQTLINEGSAILVSDTPGADCPTVITASDEFIENYSELMFEILDALDETTTWINENPEEYAAYMNETLGTDPEVILNVFDSYNFDITGVQDDLITHLTELLQFAKDEGFLSNNDVEAEALYTTIYNAN